MKLTLDAEPAELLLKSGDLIVQLARQLAQHDARLEHVARYAERLLRVSSPIDAQELIKSTGSIAPAFVAFTEVGGQSPSGVLGPDIAMRAMAGAGGESSGVLSGPGQIKPVVMAWPIDMRPQDLPLHVVRDPVTLSLPVIPPTVRPIEPNDAAGMILEIEPDIATIRRLERIAEQNVLSRLLVDGVERGADAGPQPALETLVKAEVEVSARLAEISPPTPLAPPQQSRAERRRAKHGRR